MQISITCTVAIFSYALVLALPSPSKKGKTAPKDIAQSYLGWLSSVYLSLGCLWTYCDKCEPKRHPKWSQKIRALTILIFGYVVYVYYTSNMNAFLTIS